MKKTHSRLYLLIDHSVNGRKSVTISESEATPEFLAQMNSDGFNVYVTVNSFYGGRRREEDIAECKYVFIDVDLPKEDIPKEKSSYEIYKAGHRASLFSKIEAIKGEYGIYPEEVNETYKGFHILYPVDKDLSGMSKDTYFKLSSVIATRLNGDMRCRDLARVYKVPGFFDRKDGRDFEVLRVMKDTKLASPVVSDVLASMGIELVKTDSKKSLFDSAAEKTGRTIEISSVPFSEILDTLKADGREFEFGADGRLSGYDGIIWNRQGDYVNDFSHGKDSGDNRANGNWNFIKNIAFPGDSEAFSLFLTKFGVKANARKNGIPMLASLLIGIASGDYKATKRDVSDDVMAIYEKEIGSVNAAIASGVDAGEYYRMLIAVFAGISEGKYKPTPFDDGRTAYCVDLNSLMEALGLSTVQTSSRKAVVKTLATAQFLRKTVMRRVISPEDGKPVEAFGSVPLMDVFLARNDKRGISAYIVFNTKVRKDGTEDRIHYMNRNILGLEKGRGSGKKTAFAVEIDMWMKSKGVSYNCSLAKIATKLGFSYSDKHETRRAAKAFAESLKKLEIIVDYSFTSAGGISFK